MPKEKVDLILIGKGLAEELKDKINKLEEYAGCGSLFGFINAVEEYSAARRKYKKYFDVDTMEFDNKVVQIFRNLEVKSIKGY